MIIDAKWSNLRPSIFPTAEKGRWQRLNVVDVEAPGLDATIAVRLPAEVEEDGITAFLEASQELKKALAEAGKKQPVAFQVTLADADKGA